MAAYVANLLFSNVYCIETKKKPLDAYHVVMVLHHKKKIPH